MAASRQLRRSDSAAAPGIPRLLRRRSFVSWSRRRWLARRHLAENRMQTRRRSRTIRDCRRAAVCRSRGPPPTPLRWQPSMPLSAAPPRRRLRTSSQTTTQRRAPLAGRAVVVVAANIAPPHPWPPGSKCLPKTKATARRTARRSTTSSHSCLTKTAIITTSGTMIVGQMRTARMSPTSRCSSGCGRWTASPRKPPAPGRTPPVPREPPLSGRSVAMSRQLPYSFSASCHRSLAPSPLRPLRKSMPMRGPRQVLMLWRRSALSAMAALIRQPVPKWALVMRER
mmetsp:Transcript_2272/g.6779  ORF Transcript_2272/g.6779 Transcript_2272/m.6779 type:complete len:283 (-) Transcript_2272:2703-3551(-)